MLNEAAVSDQVSSYRYFLVPRRPHAGHWSEVVVADSFCARAPLATSRER